MSESNIKHLEKLTPVKNIEKMGAYKEVLNFIFNEPDLLNIAVTGPYSAGKSSVINTYKEENKSKKFMHISLAHFEDTSSVTSDNISKTDIEGKILNQIIHQINPKHIPQTNFKIKTNISYIKVLLTTLLTVLLVFILFFLLLFQKWSSHVGGLDDGRLKKALLLSTSNEFFIFSLGVFMLLAGISLFFLVKKQLERPFLKRVKVEKYEIEVFESEKDPSFFDKHLDDILYLFRNSNTDAFVFEDIDRFNMNVIFSKLREINILINKNSTNKIRFIYLLRDDIFTSKDRTKFFDFLMPIVPVMDSSNSYDKIIEIFNKGGILEQFDSTFLERLSLYVDDMRILKNIYNEYVIYHKAIQGTELKADKLLAIITYKNLFPKDFSNLQYQSGHVYKIFSNKGFVIDKIKEELNKKLDSNTILIEKIEYENLNNVDELDAIYFTYPGFLRIDSNYQYNYSSPTEFIKALKSSHANIFNQNGYRVNLDQEWENLNAIPKYVERKELINGKANNRVSLLQEENVKLREELKRINSLKLKDLITKENIKDIFKDEGNTEITNSSYYDLVKYLIRNGYIDETYFDYLTYFWGQDLSRVDKIFLRSITDEKAKEFDYKLEKVERVVARLRESDFENEETLNFYLLDYLLKNNHHYLPLFLKQIIRSKHYEFVFNYLEWTNESGEFVRKLNKSWKSLWSELLSDSTINKVQKKKYMIETMYHSKVEDIIAMNDNDCLKEYISLSSDFLELEDPKIDLIIQSLSALRVKFYSINYLNANRELFKAVYRNNLYTLNYPMIKLILSEVYGEEENKNLRQKNYTIISSNPDEALTRYIEENINEYMLIMIENSDGEIRDSEEAIISILNNENIDESIKKSYLQLLSTILTNVRDITKDMWEAVIQSNNLKPTVENVLIYYFDYAGIIDSTLIDYLNSSDGLVFNFENLVNDYEAEDLNSFFTKIIETNELKNEIYEMILKDSNTVIEEFLLTDIEIEKLIILIRLGIIDMNVENLIFIRENFPDQTLFFITRNFNKYLKLINEEIIKEEEIILLLDDSSIPVEQRLELLKHYKSTISLQSSNYSEEIKGYIMKNNLDLADLEYVISNYENASIGIKKVIEDIVVMHYEIIGERIESKKLLKEVSQRDELNNESKMEILFPSLNYLSKEEIKEYLAILNLDDFLSLFNGKRPKIKKVDINHKFLTYFEEKGWVTSFNEDPIDSNYYRANGKITALHR